MEGKRKNKDLIFYDFKDDPQIEYKMGCSEKKIDLDTGRPNGDGGKDNKGWKGSSSAVLPDPSENTGNWTGILWGMP